jgi:hypothetical protein
MNIDEFLGLNEMRGISEHPVVSVPRSVFLLLFTFSITAFPNLRYCKGFCEDIY